MLETTIENRFWIEKEGKPFLGQGRVRLLEEIKTSGSISKAANKLNMSYKKAWHLIESMNQLSTKPLVVKETGGKNGGGTKLTMEGNKAIDQFRKLEKKSRDFFSNEQTSLEV